MSSPLYLIDVSGYIFRAFHALPPMTRSDGTPIGAVYGFVSMLSRLLNEQKIENVAVIFDAARQNWRYDVYAEYKANRSETPPDLIPQFPIIREAVEAFGLQPIELEGYEADDLIAAYAKAARANGQEVVIVSGDKDLMQLVGDGVSMLDPIKNIVYDPEAVHEKFGVYPERVVDVQALAGDAVDNVPGVPGIGIKTAALLINEFGDLQSLLDGAHSIKQPKRRESLIEYREQALISLRLVTLDADAPLPLPLEDLVPHGKDNAAIVDFAKAQGFKSLVNRLQNSNTSIAISPATETSPAEVAIHVFDRSRYETVQTLEQLQVWIERARVSGVVAIDTETDSLSAWSARLVGISLATSPNMACYIPLGHKGAPADLLSASVEIPQITLGECVVALAPLLRDESVLKIGHNLKYDMQVLAQHGLEICAYDDTMLLSYSLDGTANGNGMDALSQHWLGHTPIAYGEVTGKGKAQISFDRVPLDKATEYAAEDADVTLRLWHILKPRLAREKQVNFYETIERPLPPIIAAMETHGVLIDSKVLKGLSGRFAGQMTILEAEVHDLAGQVFNLGSPKQLGTILFDQLGLKGGKKTRTGDWSTDVDILEELAAENPIVAKLLEWRSLAKLKSTYSDSLVQQADNNGRVHTAFSMAATNTGRLASTDPNLQNIPIRSEDGRLIRKAFIAPPGKSLLSIDYSQIELRLAAAIAGVKTLQQAFKDGVDVHTATAAQVFGVATDAVTSELRRQAKAINFGIIYGISGWGLAQQLGISPLDANAYIKRYLGQLPELSQWFETTREFARQHGYVMTLFGRKCTIRGMKERNAAQRAFAERQAINAPMQGSAADLIKKAMTECARVIAVEKLPVAMLLQVHDELLFEVDADKVAEIAPILKAVMEKAAGSLAVPILAEAKCGKSWAEGVAL